MDTVHSPYAVLQFGDTVDGKAEIIATYDMLGVQSYYYDTARHEYVVRPRDFLWKLPLSHCKNRNEIGRNPWPLACNLEHYHHSGLDCLGYIGLACETPQFFEYLDNPGLMVLLAAQPDRAKRILSKRPGRVAIVKELTGYAHIRNFHINWLKKVRPGTKNPAAIADNLQQSILKIRAIDSRSQTGSYAARLFKLFAHQKQWELPGLTLARMLVKREDAPLDGADWLLRSYNGDEPGVMARAREILADIGKPLRDELGRLDDSIPFLVKLRARAHIRNDEFLTLDFSKKLCRGMHDAMTDRDLVDYYALLLCDDDIPPPSIPGNPFVTHLDTLEKIRSQARNARNCLWSVPVLNKVLGRIFDLYAVQGENLYTISVDRETLDVRMIEAASGNMIKPRDLRIIADWFDESTRLPA